HLALFFYQFTPLYGHNRQICKNGDLPVTVRRVLRADLQKRGFARNREADFTGRFAKTRICP
ncbi:MAG: hypothetical protein ACIRZM_10230, partial [Ligilactobacillus ruminis]